MLRAPDEPTLLAAPGEQAAALEAFGTGVLSGDLPEREAVERAERRLVRRQNQRFYGASSGSTAWSRSVASGLRNG